MSISIESSRGVPAPPSEVHDGHLYQRFMMSVSIESSRGAPISEVHDERLHRKFTGSASIEAEKTQGFDRKKTQGFDRRYWLGPPSKGFNQKSRSKARLESLHRRSSLGVSPSEGFQPECLHWRVSTEGLHRKGFNRWSHLEGFPPRVSIGGVPTQGLHRRGSEKGSHQRGSNRGSPSEGFQPRVSIGGVLTGVRLILYEETLGSRSEKHAKASSRGMRPFIKELGEEADALPTIAPAEAPHSCNRIKSPWTQDTSTEDVPSDRGVSKGKDATTNKLNKDADLNGRFRGGGCTTALEEVKSKQESLLLPKIAPSLRVIVYVHSATDVASHLVAYMHERKGGYSWPFVAESISKDIPIRKRSKKPLSPILKGSGASGGGRTTLKKVARRSHSFHQKDGFARIVLNKRITEHAHKVRAIGYDSKLPLWENRGGIALCLLRRLAAPYLIKGLVTHYLLRRLDAPYLLRGLATPYLMKRLAALYLLRGLATSYLWRRLVAPCLLRGVANPYLMRRLCSLVITSGPKVTFVTPAILMDRSCNTPKLGHNGI
nr:hypothetical protein [Tanacetum cinerariifolium]